MLTITHNVKLLIKVIEKFEIFRSYTIECDNTGQGKYLLFDLTRGEIYIYPQQSCFSCVNVKFFDPTANLVDIVSLFCLQAFRRHHQCFIINFM